jgi:hypothetical protein
MSKQLRLSPSGPVVGSISGGFRLRYSDIQSSMSGSLAIPTSKGVVCADGQGGTNPITRSFAAPQPDNKYRANLRMDVLNPSTSIACQVTLFLETSVNGTDWTVQSKNAHVIPTSLTSDGARQISVALPLIKGSDIGVLATTANLYLRASYQLSVGTGALVSSPTTSGSVTGLNGTIYMELEEDTGDL